MSDMGTTARPECHPKARPSKDDMFYLEEITNFVGEQDMGTIDWNESENWRRGYELVEQMRNWFDYRAGSLSRRRCTRMEQTEEAVGSSEVGADPQAGEGRAEPLESYGAGVGMSRGAPMK